MTRTIGAALLAVGLFFPIFSNAAEQGVRTEASGECSLHYGVLARWTKSKVSLLASLPRYFTGKSQSERVGALNDKQLTFEAMKIALAQMQGFDPAVHIAENGSLQVDAPQYFYAGELLGQVRERGFALTPEQATLADAYQKSAQELHHSSISFTGTITEVNDLAGHARHVMAPMDVALNRNRITFPAGNGSSDPQVLRLKYLARMAQGQGGKVVSELLEQHASDFRYAASQVHLVDQAWGRRSASLHDLLNVLKGSDYRLNTPSDSSKQPTYRPKSYSPADFDENGELIAKAKARSVNDGGNWTHAGAVPVGKSDNPAHKEKFLISSWGDDVEHGYGDIGPTSWSAPGRDARVLEVWGKDGSGKWKVEEVQAMIRMPDGKWTPQVFHKDQSTNKWEPQDTGKCMVCHLRGSYVGPVPMQVGVKPYTIPSADKQRLLPTDSSYAPGIEWIPTEGRRHPLAQFRGVGDPRASAETVTRHLGLKMEDLKGKRVLSLGEGVSGFLPQAVQSGVDAYGVDAVYAPADLSTLPQTQRAAVEDYRRSKELDGRLMPGDVLAYLRSVPRKPTFDKIVSHDLVQNLHDYEAKTLIDAVSLLNPGGQLCHYGFSDAQRADFTEYINRRANDLTEEGRHLEVKWEKKEDAGSHNWLLTINLK
jgi:SAM-dependent methyltransferase